MRGVLAILLVLAIAAPALAGADVAACPTIVGSLYADYQASTSPPPGMVELNPVTRAVGAGPYFGALIAAAAASCRDTPSWRTWAMLVWAAETWAVNTWPPKPGGSVPLLRFDVGL